jgi:hypothetical protein
MGDSRLGLGSTSDIFTLKPDWSNLPGRTFLFGRDIIQRGNGLIAIRNLTSELPYIVEYRFFNIDKQTEFDLLDFFCSRYGRLEKFWLPIFYSDFKLYSNILNGSSEFHIYPNEFQNIQRGYERFFIRLNNGDLITRRIDHFETDHLVDGYLVMISTESIDRNIAVTDIDVFGKLILCRFNQDTVELNHISTALSELILTFKELPSESWSS